MRMEQGSPLAKLPVGNTISFTNVLDRTELEEMFSQDSQDEEQPVCTIGDDVIGEYGMSVMTAIADDPHYTERASDTFAIYEVSYGSAVVGMDVTIASGSTDGTGFLFRNKPGHISVKEFF